MVALSSGPDEAGDGRLAWRPPKSFKRHAGRLEMPGFFHRSILPQLSPEETIY
jgi:hypothetical protein